jgi:hypothetical protein
MLRNVPFDRATVTVYSYDHKGELLRTFDKAKPTMRSRRRPSLDADGLPTFVEDAPQPVWDTTPAGVMASESWGHSYLPTTRLLGPTPLRQSWTHQDAADDLAIERLMDTQFASLLTNLWARYHSDILARVRSAQESGLARVMTQILAPLYDRPQRATDFETSYARVERFMKRQQRDFSFGSQQEFESRYNTDPQLRSVVDSLSIVEEQVEAAMTPRNKLQALVNRLFTNKSITFGEGQVGVTTAGDVSIPLAALSSGEKQLLRLLLETLRNHRNPTIIDEPELSLHVDWQHELIEDLRDLKPDSQLLVATHSPEIMARVPDDNIFRL